MDINFCIVAQNFGTLYNHEKEKRGLSYVSWPQEHDVVSTRQFFTAKWEGIYFQDHTLTSLQYVNQNHPLASTQFPI